MNVWLQQARKTYWAEIASIRTRENCGTEQAKAIYRQNGSYKPATPSVSAMTIDQILEHAAQRVTDLTAELESLLVKSEEVRREIAQWEKLCDASRQRECVEAAVVA